MDEIVAGLLDEWFGAARRDPSRAPARSGFWFSADDDRDEGLRRRYGTLARRASEGELLDWQDEPESRLALILLLDQLPRNLHRGTPRAFASDHRALALALAGIATGMERALGPVEQAFFYLPLQHAEDRAAQRLSVREYRALAERTPEHREVFDWFLKFAEEHRDIVERFGRFPHRNAILGRETTPAEQAFLDSGAPGYGQG